MFGRHWRISSDDFVCPAAVELVVRLSWIVILVFVLVFHIQVRESHSHDDISVNSIFAGDREPGVSGRGSGVPADHHLSLHLPGAALPHLRPQPGRHVSQRQGQDGGARHGGGGETPPGLGPNPPLHKHHPHRVRVCLDWVRAVFHHRGLHEMHG